MTAVIPEHRVETFTFSGYQIAAPDFDPETFEQAVTRAFRDGVRCQRTLRPGVYVCSSRRGSSYTTSRDGCTCPAGAFGRPCKHVSLVALIEAITGDATAEHNIRGP